MKKLLPKTVNNSQGFTLVELLVVIAIIAIISVIGVATFTGLQAKGRDSTRKADIQAIGKAMEAHFSGSAYVALAASFFANLQIPTDPTNTGAYKYCVLSSPRACVAADTAVGAGQPPAGAIYTICANLETTTGPGGVSYVCTSNQQ